MVLSALTPSDPFQRVGEFVLQYCELCRVYEVRLYLLWCNIVHVVETYVSGGTAKSAERGLFVQCWQGIGRNCHGGNGGESMGKPSKCTTIIIASVYTLGLFCFYS